MAKMDKEALMKNKFWIGLGAFALLWAIGLLTLQLSAGGPIEAKKQEYQKAKTGIESWTSKAKNRVTFLPPWEKYGKTYRDHKNTIWQQAWDAQKTLLKWPAGGEYGRIWDRSVSFDAWKKEMSDNDTVAGRSTTLRREYRDDFYYPTLFPQLSDVEKKQPPHYTYYLEKAMAPVEFKGGRLGFESIMAPATGAAGSNLAGGSGALGGFPGPGGPPQPGPGPGPGPGSMGPGGDGSGMAAGNSSIVSIWQKTPSVEEIWLAQEDFSVKYELLQVIRRTVDRVARLEPFEVKKLPENAIKAHGFRNDRWEIVLYVEQKGNNTFISKKSTIKNVSPRVLLMSNPRTRGPLVFQLKQGEARYPLRLKGEPIGSGAQTEFAVVGEQFSVDLINLANPVELTQVFDWSTSPIRRIDAIRLGYHSHRTSNLPLVANKHFPPPEPTAAEGTGTDPAMTMGSDPMSGGMPGPGGPMGPGGPAASGGPGGMGMPAGPPPTTSENGLAKNRYVTVTGQARSMPIAMTLILDQTHLHDFLTELLNCQLRFQITQTQVRHVRDVASQLESVAGTGTPNPMGGGAMPGPPMGNRPPIGPGPGPGPGSDPTAGAGAAGNPLDPNLIELTVYGMSTLYEKFHITKEPATTDPMGMTP